MDSYTAAREREKRDREARARAGLIADLRALAAWLEEHPRVPVPFIPQACAPVTLGTEEQRRAAVDEFAAQHHLTAHMNGRSYEVAMPFGRITYFRYFIADAAASEPAASEDIPAVAA
jgi:hypothetical protein